MASEQQRRYCWVCFASEDEDQEATWVQPCRCRGSTRWVHQACLQRWIDEKQGGQSGVRVTCPQCGTAYVLQWPPAGGAAALLELLDEGVGRACPLLAGILLLASLYWSAITYGALTVLQVLGPRDGLQWLEQGDPLLLLVALPSIPAALLLGRALPWDRCLYSFLHQHPLPGHRQVVEPEPPGPPALNAATGASRLVLGALALPTAATLAGRLLFRRVLPTGLTRTLLGGLVFVVLKGVLRAFLARQRRQRRSRRKVLDFDSES
ncbi:E3 ubiquitin-protein ligase MARCHF5-like [Ornithodoros turicata]